MNDGLVRIIETKSGVFEINLYMGISSNVLWHQTKKRGLWGIIRNKCLYFSYSVESVTSTIYNAEFAYPMVSVCDLPLSETGAFLKKYGNYTIGFTSDWGKRNHFSAVWYCDKNSFALKTILDLFAQKIGAFGDDDTKDTNYQKIIYILSYVKQYEGPLPKRNYKKYRFYDERELRCVPDAETLGQIGEKTILWDYLSYKKAHNDSSLLPKSLCVPFEWDDIKYIIVEKENEKAELKRMIEKKSGRKDLQISFFTNTEVKDDIIGVTHDVKKTRLKQ